jgi:hypothetical protein
VATFRELTGPETIAMAAPSQFPTNATDILYAFKSAMAPQHLVVLFASIEFNPAFFVGYRQHRHKK